MVEIVEFEKRYNNAINDFIISIYVEEFGFENHRCIIENEDNEIYINRGGNLWLAIDNNEIVGTIAVYKYNDEYMELKKLYVKEEYRGKGLSKELYNKVIEFCLKEKYKKVFLGTYEKMSSAINFYLKNGFKELEYAKKNDGAKFFELNIQEV